MVYILLAAKLERSNFCQCCISKKNKIIPKIMVLKWFFVMYRSTINAKISKMSESIHAMRARQSNPIDMIIMPSPMASRGNSIKPMVSIKSCQFSLMSQVWCSEAKMRVVSGQIKIQASRKTSIPSQILAGKSWLNLCAGCFFSKASPENCWKWKWIIRNSRKQNFHGNKFFAYLNGSLFILNNSILRF